MNDRFALRPAPGAVLAAALAGCASAPPQPPAPPEAAPTAEACPAGVPAGARCLRGQDSTASHSLIVVPAQWSGALVVLAHGGPALGPPQRTRADECLGARKPAAQRTPEQARKLKTIVDVLKIPESSVVGHLNWGTFTLRDVVQKNGGVSPFGNDGVRYAGSADDATLNAGVQRFRADPQAVARFAADVDHRGRFAVPVISAHGIGDATVFVEGQDTLRRRMVAAGNGDRLVKSYVDSAEHSYWGDAHYPPLFEALLDWVDTGRRPTPAGIAGRCLQLRAASPGECRFRPEYVPQPLSSRIAPR